MNERIIVVIPARYASTRFPGKPLARIAGKTMIERVWERCMSIESDAEILIATDDERIAAEVRSFGGEAVMTPDDLASGSDRVAWVAAHTDATMFVNVQGDEPLLPPATIDAVIRSLRDSDADIATAACPLRSHRHMFDPNIVKLVTDRNGNALYFSRAGIPFPREKENDGNAFDTYGVFLQHIGIYAFHRQSLLRFAALEESTLERVEKLEQLRALEHGMRICVSIVPAHSQSVDTPEDLAKVEKSIRLMNRLDNSDD